MNKKTAVKTVETIETIKTDALVIGCGPVGIFCAFELGLYNISCHLVDVLDKIGGQCAELYPDKPIYDIPGFDKISGQQLIANLVKQTEPFKPTFHLNQLVTSLQKQPDGSFITGTDCGTQFHSKIVVIAGGAGSFTPKRMLLDEAKSYENRGLYYSVKNKSKLKNQDIVVFGGGDSALDWCNALAVDANSLTLVHRRSNFRAQPNSVDKMRQLQTQKKIEFIEGQVKAINKGHRAQNNADKITADKITSVTIQKNTKENVEIKADSLLVFFGLTMKLGPIADFGLNLHSNLITVETTNFCSSVAGIYAIGDINSYPGKLKLILSGFHEAALMAHHAQTVIYPEKKPRFFYTTTSSSLQSKFVS